MIKFCQSHFGALISWCGMFGDFFSEAQIQHDVYHLKSPSITTTVVMVARWWFQIYFLMFTPKIGEDSHFDSYFFRWVEATNQVVIWIFVLPHLFTYFIFENLEQDFESQVDPMMKKAMPGLAERIRGISMDIGEHT